MSLLGIRDISNLETPPPDRKAIETRILRFDAETIKRAIHRELNRDGQVYFVHNRVYDIQTVAERLQTIVPEARIAIAHGQMGGDALERTMLGFLRRESDILVATTIIESRPRHPQRQHHLHQRGGQVRPGRPAPAPRTGRPVQAPCVRLSAARIGQAGDSQCGQAAQGDRGVHRPGRRLQDRPARPGDPGAGNILGAEQSGHIESVGYELYCSLLAVGRARPDPQARAADVRLLDRAVVARLSAEELRPRPHGSRSSFTAAWAGSGAWSRLADFRQELIDRFGPLPPPLRT